MWQCASCEYVNDDWDERCLRCGVDRVTSEAERAAATTGPSDTKPARPAELSDEERRILQSVPREPEKPFEPPAKPGKAEAGDVDALIAVSRASESAASGRRHDMMPVLIIAISLIGLCAVAYIAWVRGLISMPEPQAPAALDFTALGFETRPAYPVNAELTALLESTDRSLRALKPHAQLLYDSEAAFDRINANLVPLPDEAGIRQQLDMAGELARLLAEDYREFEEDTVPRGRRLDPQLVELLREQYAQRMQQLLEVLQVGYLNLANPEHTAFVQKDNLANHFEEFGFIDSEQFATHWQAIREQRRQQELDEQYAELIDELEAWYSTLATLHEEVDRVIRGLGEVSSNRGRLNPAAVKLVKLLDDFAFKIEDLNTQFEEYVQTIPETDSDTVNELVERFRVLALEDHMYCFGEIYRRYSEDRYAELEEYDNLLTHYEYAEQWWPQKRADYRGIYTTYENRWKENWLD